VSALAQRGGDKVPVPGASAAAMDERKRRHAQRSPTRNRMTGIDALTLQLRRYRASLGQRLRCGCCPKRTGIKRPLVRAWITLRGNQVRLIAAAGGAAAPLPRGAMSPTPVQPRLSAVAPPRSAIVVHDSGRRYPEAIIFTTIRARRRREVGDYVRHFTTSNRKWVGARCLDRACPP
jgi:hypothetical protein